MSAGRGSESFLGRWSARKRGADDAARPRDDAAAETEAPDANASRVPEAGPAPRASESASRVEVADAFAHPAPEERAVFGTDGPGVHTGSALITGADARSAVGSSTMDVAPATLDAEEPTEPPSLTDADMPPIESLHAGSDLSGFFSKGVSAALRRAALRHVFAQPVYNVRDGLNDYDGDYTVFEPLGDTITSDMRFHAARRERERLAAEREEAERLERERLVAEREDGACDDDDESRDVAATEEERDVTTDDATENDTARNDVAADDATEGDVAAGDVTGGVDERAGLTERRPSDEARDAARTATAERSGTGGEGENRDVTAANADEPLASAVTVGAGIGVTRRSNVAVENDRPGSSGAERAPRG